MMTGQQLKNSILQMAVQGKLVPQDQNDEPASVLLERIRKEKEQLIKDGKIKKEKKPSYIFRGADNLPYEKVGKNEPVCIADEVPFEIPESWEWVRLSKIVYNRGQMTPAKDFCYIDIGSIDNKNQKLSIEENIVTADKAPSRARKIVTIGDILYSTVRPYLHNMCIIDRSFSHTPIASTGFAVLTCHSGFLNEFLFYYLMSPDFDTYANNTDNAKGVAYPAINDNKLYQALIPVPPKAEQERIVKKLKDVLPYVVTYGVKYSEAKSLNNGFTNKLKKSILQEAVQGKLVSQEPTDEPASVLLERIHAEKERLIQEGKIKRDKHESVIFRRDNSHYEKLDGIERSIDDEIPFEIPESWEWVRFYNIASFQNGDRSKNYPNRNEYVSNGVAWINTGHITSDGFLNVNTMNYITEEKYNSLSNGHIQKGDLVYCLRGATFGKVARIEPFSKGAIASSLMIIRPFDVSLRNYIYWYLRSPIAYIELHKYSNGSAQPNLAAKDVGKYLVPIPPLDEQIRIINESIRLLAIIENI